MSEIESPDEHRVKRLVLVNGVVHHSHDSWLLVHHFMWDKWRMEHVSTETADEGLHGRAQNARIWVEAPFERPRAKTQDGLAE